MGMVGMKKTVYDIHAKNYDSWYDRNSAVYASEIEAIQKLMPSCSGKNSIEIGVGTGRFASKLGINYGIDPSVSMLEISASRGVRCIKGVSEWLPVKSSSMGLALIVTSFCLMDANMTLEEVHRILSTEGYFIIAFVEKNGILGEKYRKKASKSRFYRNVVFRTTENIISMLKEHGFGDITVMQTLFKPLNQIQRPEEAEEGFGRGSFVVIKAKCIKNG
ncbi:Ubiquinone/menaquinone biosynthesis C-methylase UbiE [Methanolobus vulcani]|jgi:ubiquinone/menaquinone biosynthesis C-methylase UbiE|uniref:Ubiquinone/menaquinone biosynthesis C-methylase UbiE n=2 Tax=Methanolobus vulcani TaxID=38026 RepID=A0A7Z7FD64_9EURY|nr:Ubiquinone/menaquinone biosynthesis C-methylase UbiE [Methanolobus vulcani]